MALFKDTADFATVYPALASADWTMLKPIVEVVENRQMRALVLGPSLFDTLNAAALSYQASPTAMSPALEALYRKVRPVVAYLAAHKAMPLLGSMSTSGGEVVDVSQNQEPARLWQVTAKLNSIRLLGFEHMDALLDLLLEKEGTDYPSWSEAPYRAELRESLVPTATIATRYLRDPLRSNWLLHQLRPAMRQVQNGPVKTLIGTTAFNTLLSHVVAGTGITADEQTMLEHARNAMLNLALAQRIIPLSIGIDDQGVWNYTGSGSGSQTTGGAQPAKATAMEALVNIHREEGERSLEALRLFMNPSDATAAHRTPDTSGNMLSTL